MQREGIRCLPSVRKILGQLKQKEIIDLTIDDGDDEEVDVTEVSGLRDWSRHRSFVFDVFAKDEDGLVNDGLVDDGHAELPRPLR